jgi:hypothetical protein
MQIHKLSDEEVAQVEAQEAQESIGVRAATRAAYDQLAADFEVGEYGELTLAEGDTKPTVRKNFAAAVERRGLVIDWRRGTATTLKFQITE